VSKPEASIRVNVDLTNPGQFFACCGLLELADRLWPGAEGWFEEQEFCIVSKGTLPLIVRALISFQVEALFILPNGLPVKKIIAPLRLSHSEYPAFSLTLDSWMAIKRIRNQVEVIGNPPWNFWSGQQTSIGLWQDKLCPALTEQIRSWTPNQFPRLFEQRILLSGRFGFDPGAAWHSLDVGFSPNKQEMVVASSAAVELLATVGIQRFRPVLASNKATFLYSTWGQPLAPVVAAAAIAQQVQSSPFSVFRGRVVSRGEYGALAYSTLLQGAFDE
jgi:CRISPR-associated protein Csx14